MKSETDLLDIRFEREPTMITRRVAGEIILIPVTRRMGEESALYTLDVVAAYLWERLDGQHTGRDLIEVLESAYTVEREQSAQDVRTFLEQLQSMQATRPAGTYVASSGNAE